MGALDEFLSKLDAGMIPEPKPLPPDEELRRTRLILAALCDKAARAAEEKHPGIGAAIARASRKEEELARKAADSLLVLPLARPSPETMEKGLRLLGQAAEHMAKFDANGSPVEDE